MSNIKVFSDESKFAAGGEWSNAAADIVANYPACKLLLHWDDVTNNDTTWTCRVTGAVFTAGGTGGVFTKTADGVGNSLDAPVLTSGALPIIGALHPMFSVQGKFAANNNAIEIGDRTATGIRVKPNQVNFSRIAGNSADNSTATVVVPDDGCLIGAMSNTDGSGSANGGNADGTSLITAATAKTLTPNGTWGAFTTGFNTPNGNVIKTIALFCFETPITDAAQVAAWMGATANVGRFCPSLAGRA